MKVLSKLINYTNSGKYTLKSGKEIDIFEKMTIKFTLEINRSISVKEYILLLENVLKSFGYKPTSMFLSFIDENGKEKSKELKYTKNNLKNKIEKIDIKNVLSLNMQNTEYAYQHTYDKKSSIDLIFNDELKNYYNRNASMELYLTMKTENTMYFDTYKKLYNLLNEKFSIIGGFMHKDFNYQDPECISRGISILGEREINNFIVSKMTENLCLNKPMEYLFFINTFLCNDELYNKIKSILEPEYIFRQNQLLTISFLNEKIFSSEDLHNSKEWKLIYNLLVDYDMLI